MVRVVFCTSAPPEGRHKAVAVTLDCAPFTERPTFALFSDVNTVDERHVTRGPLGTLSAAEFQTVMNKYLELHRARLI